MEQTPSPRLHPALMIAAVSVTALSLVGIGVLTGFITGKPAETANAPANVAAPAAQAVAPIPAMPAVTVNVTPAPAPATKKPAPKVVTRIVERPSQPIEIIRSEPIREVRDYRPAPAVCRDCGFIEAVYEVAQQGGEGSGLGAVAGGVIGGVLGNQVGKGSGRDLATVVGIVGGAVAGNEIEKTQKKSVRYDIVVRMDDGGIRTVSSHVQPTWRAGERVRVVNGVVTPAT
ncbi:MAG: glycine zipper 2TM domain-containing protein [Candidatus Nitricoxidivorans perseverans]|uniref:Glycine zipper 2TM domain-containing protein n=1 Tax=Candidatus Nitricoxidivorans perseverans TaxID=2975601 RepID=A0AA49FMM1_9PROT|nr:MAG: glycine zipper 2TM domain-containing protein [Candidatus Nitricoxidivorans perseverans]